MQLVCLCPHSVCTPTLVSHNGVKQGTLSVRCLNAADVLATKFSEWILMFRHAQLQLLKPESAWILWQDARASLKAKHQLLRRQPTSKCNGLQGALDSAAIDQVQCRSTARSSTAPSSRKKQRTPLFDAGSQCTMDSASRWASSRPSGWAEETTKQAPISR